jgi:predicted DNA-binding transcriptional regulator YafY
MRASRLLSILTTLQARGRVTAAALAEDCAVSLRTIYRDVDALSAAGIPIYAERGAGGGYRLLDGYRTRLNGLSPAEAEALFLAGLTRQIGELGLDAVAESARRKLLAALPEAMRDGVGRIGARFHLDAPPWFVEDESLGHLPVIADAVWRERALCIRYRSWKAEVERRVEPLGLVLKGGAWYMVARAGEGTDPRTYRIARVLALEALDEGFARPADFDLAACWSANLRRLEATLHPDRATLRMSPDAVCMMHALLSPYVRAGATVGDPGPDGWHEVTLPVGSCGEAAADLLRFGADVEVLSPPALRARMAATARGLARLYGDEPTSSSAASGR